MSWSIRWVWCCTRWSPPPTCKTATAASSLLSTLFGQFPFLRKLFADSAYTGPVFQDGAARAMRSLIVEIVKRSDHPKGFVVEPKRWIVERSIAWLNRCRRLAKDWENRNHNALAFLRLASIRLMLRRLL